MKRVWSDGQYILFISSGGTTNVTKVTFSAIVMPTVNIVNCRDNYCTNGGAVDVTQVTFYCSNYAYS